MTTFIVEVDDNIRDALLVAANTRGVAVESLLAGIAETFAAEVGEPALDWTAEERSGIEQGLAELERGEGAPVAQVFADLRARYGAR